jgi:hypothetical protein
MESQPLHPDPQSVPGHDAIHDALQDSSRRKFLGTLTGALVAGLAIQILGCTEDPVSSGSPAPGTGNGGNCALGKAAADRTGTVSANHGHVAVVTQAVQDAGVAHQLSIEGSAGHDHIVALTEADITALKAGSALTKTSSNVNSHTHTVTFAMVTSIRPC